MNSSVVQTASRHLAAREGLLPTICPPLLPGQVLVYVHLHVTLSWVNDAQVHGLYENPASACDASLEALSSSSP